MHEFHFLNLFAKIVGAVSGAIAIVLILMLKKTEPEGVSSILVQVPEQRIDESQDILLQKIEQSDEVEEVTH